MSSRDFTALTAHYWMVLIRAGVPLTGSPIPPVGSRSRLQPSSQFSLPIEVEGMQSWALVEKCSIAVDRAIAGACR
jgi:hypothetical protein